MLVCLGCLGKQTKHPARGEGRARDTGRERDAAHGQRDAGHLTTTMTPLLSGTSPTVPGLCLPHLANYVPINRAL